MEKVKKKVIYCNLLIFSGLSGLGYGLFLSFGAGVSLSVVGALLLSFGVVGAFR